MDEGLNMSWQGCQLPVSYQQRAGPCVSWTTAANRAIASSSFGLSASLNHLEVSPMAWLWTHSRQSTDGLAFAFGMCGYPGYRPYHS